MKIIMCVKDSKNVQSVTSKTKYVIMLIFLMWVVVIKYNQIYNQTSSECNNQVATLSLLFKRHHVLPSSRRF